MTLTHDSRGYLPLHWGEAGQEPPYDPYVDIDLPPDWLEGETPEPTGEHTKNFAYFRAVILGTLATSHIKGIPLDRAAIPKEHYPRGDGRYGNVAAFLFNEGQRRGGLTGEEYRELVDYLHPERNTPDHRPSNSQDSQKPWVGLSPQDRASGDY